MEISSSVKDSHQILHAILSGDSSEHVDFSTAHFNTHAAHTAHSAHTAHAAHAHNTHNAHAAHTAHTAHHQNHQLQSDSRLSLNELHWHPHASVQACGEERVEVFSINNPYVWQNHPHPPSQGDAERCLQSLATHLDPKIAKNDHQGDHGKTSQTQNNTAKSKKKPDNSKSTPKFNKNKGKLVRKIPKEKKKKLPQDIQNKKKDNLPRSVIGNIPNMPGLPTGGAPRKPDPSAEKTTPLEDDVPQVIKRFASGCECTDSCFNGLNPEAVFRHRLNIAELTKDEHDMYLMGLTMATLCDWAHTNRNKERRRLRANYVYQGRSVCLQAFLYLENCTSYQVKRIRKHVMTHGVCPRVHGNHGKRPHNTFSLEIYCHATEFLKFFVREHTGKDLQNISSKNPILLGPDVTRKSIHNEYIEYCEKHVPDTKMMSYSSFRHFMKEQYPFIRIRGTEGVGVPREGIKRPRASVTRKKSSSVSESSHSDAESASDVSKAVSSSREDVEASTFAEVLMNENQNTESDQEPQSRHASDMASEGHMHMLLS